MSTPIDHHWGSIRSSQVQPGDWVRVPTESGPFEGKVSAVSATSFTVESGDPGKPAEIVLKDLATVVMRLEQVQ
jgi:hypothetical protein